MLQSMFVLKFIESKKARKLAEDDKKLHKYVN